MFARTLFTLVVAAAVTAACSDPTSPTMRRLAGSYEAARTAATNSYLATLTFTTTQDGVTTDWLAEGAFIHLTLRANGTTAGRLFIPNLNENGEREQGVNFDEDLTGTWSVSGDVVQLDHAADTVLRDMALHVRGNRLEGEEAFDEEFPYHFTDLTARVDYQLAERHTLRASGLFTRDLISRDLPDVLHGNRVAFGNGAGRVSLLSTFGGLRARHAPEPASSSVPQV